MAAKTLASSVSAVQAASAWASPIGRNGVGELQFAPRARRRRRSRRRSRSEHLLGRGPSRTRCRSLFSSSGSRGEVDLDRLGGDALPGVRQLSDEAVDSAAQIVAHAAWSSRPADVPGEYARRRGDAPVVVTASPVVVELPPSSPEQAAGVRSRSPDRQRDGEWTRLASLGHLAREAHVSNAAFSQTPDTVTPARQLNQRAPRLGGVRPAVRGRRSGSPARVSGSRLGTMHLVDHVSRGSNRYIGAVEVDQRGRRPDGRSHRRSVDAP